MERKVIVPCPTDAKYFVVHDFEPMEDEWGNGGICASRTIRAATSDFPPDVLFDAVYASVVSSAWGHESFNNYTRQTWLEEFYSGIPVPTHGDGGMSTLRENRMNASEKHRLEADARDDRHAKRTHTEEEEEGIPQVQT
jgi:hypothetical protein